MVSEASAPQRFSAAALGGFAGGALLLAAIGLYGVLAFVVAQRTREIGVRDGARREARAGGGARRRAGHAARGDGLVLGLASALGAARLLRSLLYDTRSYDPLTFVAVPVLLAAVSLCACYLPARKAATVDPVVTAPIRINW